LSTPTVPIGELATMPVIVGKRIFNFVIAIFFRGFEILVSRKLKKLPGRLQILADERKLLGEGTDQRINEHDGNDRDESGDGVIFPG
jgi:hypothetical protein